MVFVCSLKMDEAWLWDCGGRRQSLGDDAETPRRMVTLAVALEKGTRVFSHQQAGGLASLGLAVTNF